MRKGISSRAKAKILRFCRTDGVPEAARAYLRQSALDRKPKVLGPRERKGKATMPSPRPLQLGVYYHIFNRGNNGETIFRTAENVRFFLDKYAKAIEPVAHTYAYCLLPNHFHFLILTKIEEATEDGKTLIPSRQFSRLFGSYAKSYNAAHDRSGSLFENPFERIPVENDAHLRRLVTYIHENPQRHGLVEDFRAWSHSSYRSLLSAQATRLRRDDVLGWFGGRGGFVAAHGLEHNDDLWVLGDYE
jgi:putative transposase